IGEMSASIAHEIKQPLSAVVTNSDVGLRWLAKLEPSRNVQEAAAALKRILNDVSRATQIVESVRSMFKRGDSEVRELSDVNDVVRDVLAMLRSELQEHAVTAHAALSDGTGRVIANRVQIQQVVLNLARNAIEAMGSMDDRERILTLCTASTGSDE